nr:hypothetical protein [Tanacetum cinerariifolium]
MYRKDSERNVYVVDKDHEEEESTSPPARVFRQRLPEWTADITNYKPKDFPQQECAIRCNLHGYLALPVFDSTTRLCVGVIELLASSKYTSFAYEVHQFQRALKSVNLTTKHAQDSPTLNVHNEHRDNDLEKIFSILKVVCETHRLPLAQTWAMSPFSSFTPHEQMLKKSCNSFNTRCLGKSCMSTAALPFYVQDLGLWRFREACREQHLDKSRGSVGRALLSHGSSFCEDVTKLSKEEYPLGSYAQMSGLTSCFAIFLHSVESNDGYVIEFFLSLNIEDVRYVQNLVQTLKENTEMASGIVLGDKSPTQVVGPPTESTSLYLDRDPQSTIITATTTRKNKTLEMVSSDSESHVAVEAKTNSTQDMNQLSPKQDTFRNNNDGAITSTEIVVQEAVTTDIINAVTRDIINAVDGRDYDNPSANNTKSLLKNDIITDVEEKSKPVKRGRKRKIDNLTMEAVRKHLGKPIDEAAKSLEGNRSTLKRFCRDNNMPSWPLPKHNKKTVHVTDSKLSQSKRHGLSGKWWVCGKHSYFPSKSDSIYQVARLMVYLNRWKNKKTKYHLAVCESTEKPEQPDVDLKLPESSLVYASSKQIVVGAVSDAAKVTVKATFKDDILKFPFSTSSGLVELEKEVAQRITLKSKKLCLKYRDEDDDLILLACDADLQYLLGKPKNCERRLIRPANKKEKGFFSKEGMTFETSKKKDEGGMAMTFQCPILNSTNYTIWAVKIKALFNVYGIWEALEPKEEVDTKKNTMAIAYLFQALPEQLTLQVAHHTNAADIWKDLKARFVGIDKVKEARLQTLESEFETLKMKDSESLDEFTGKISQLVSQASNLGSTIENKRLVRKLLGSVPTKFIQIVVAIEQFADLNTMTFKKLLED